MTVWIEDEKHPSHRNVRLNLEAHSGFEYLGDLDDEEMGDFLQTLDPTLDVKQQLQLLKYFGYLHLFITAKKEKK